jgi:putative membrane protein
VDAKNTKHKKAGSILAPPAASVEPDKRGTEYLANERTFLAWIRTSVSLISLGFVVERFGLFLRDLGDQGPAHAALRSSFSRAATPFVVGELMMAFGGVLAFLAAWRYHVVSRDIERGVAKADRLTILGVAFAIMILSAVMISFARP